MPNVLSEAVRMQADWQPSPQISQNPAHSPTTARIVRAHLAAMARERLKVRRTWKEGFRAAKAMSTTSFDELLRFHSRVVDLTNEVREIFAAAPKKGAVQ